MAKLMIDYRLPGAGSRQPSAAITIQRQPTISTQTRAILTADTVPNEAVLG
jgi:hypothetical protein